MKYATILCVIHVLTYVQGSVSPGPKLYLSQQLPGMKSFWHCSCPAVGLERHVETPAWSSLAHHFTLHELAPLRGRGVRLVLIDTGLAAYTSKDGQHYQHPDISAPYKRCWGNLNIVSDQRLPYPPHVRMLAHQEYNPAIAHGTHTYGIIAAKKRFRSLSVSPQACVIMIKAFNDNGVSKKALLLRAVAKAIELKADILLLSLKIDDAFQEGSPASVRLNELLKQVPYVVAAAGNSGATDRLAYPARLSAVTISVGAFGFDATTKQYFLAPFSQYEPGRGPLFLAPGVDIISTAVPADAIHIPYLCMSGTSAAAAMVAGCLALALAQFGAALTKEHILAIFRASTVKMPTIPTKASLYGVLDMRTALFMMHVLAAAKKKVGSKQFNEEFSVLLASLSARVFSAQTQSSSLKAAVRQCTKALLH